MQLPIQYAFSFPERWRAPVPPLDLAAAGRLEFEPADAERFPCLGLAFRALTGDPGLPIVLNAANEVAVAGFLQRRLPFLGIPERIREAMDAYGQLEPSVVSGLGDVRRVDRWARDFTARSIGEVQ
jgi:1-deoxy-D-xylulose-5-phosphate reductoisomerase